VTGIKAVDAGGRLWIISSGVDKAEGETGPKAETMLMEPGKPLVIEDARADRMTLVIEFPHQVAEEVGLLHLEDLSMSLTMVRAASSHCFRQR
jgi:hypothetical protein